METKKIALLYKKKKKLKIKKKSKIQEQEKKNKKKKHAIICKFVFFKSMERFARRKTNERKLGKGLFLSLT